MPPRPPTHSTTLIRLVGIDPTIEAVLDILDYDQLKEINAELETFNVDGSPGFIVYGSFVSQAEGRRLLQITTGLSIPPHENRRSGELLVIIVDGVPYAYGYGEGWRLIPDRVKDQRFGLQVAIRCLNPDQVQNIVRRKPGMRGRLDSTHIPVAVPVWQFGLSQQAEIVRRISGRPFNLPTTYGRVAKRPASIHCAAGLNVRLALQPAELVADIRVVAGICATRPAHPALEFVDDIRPVANADVVGILDLELDDRLGAINGESDHLAPVVPDACLDRFLEAGFFTYKIGAAQARTEDSLDLQYLLCHTSRLTPGKRTEALRNGRIEIYSDTRTENLGGAAAIKWLEADIHYDGQNYFLIDGKWYELGQRYLASVRTQIIALLAKGSALTLPAWQLGTDKWEEKDYNKKVGEVDGYVCMDRDCVQTRLHRGNGVEVCDLVGPGFELVMVKKAEKSGPLSHLFSQSLVAVLALKHTPEAVTLFGEKIRQKTGGRMLPDGYQPSKVVFAILLKEGEKLTVDTLFPFAQVALLHTAEVLHSHNIAVEVLGLSAAEPVEQHPSAA